MHGYMKYTQPLFIQSIMAIKGIYESKVGPRDWIANTCRLPNTDDSVRTQIVKIHVLGRPATDDLKRPFAAAPSLLGGATAASNETAAVEGKKTQ